MIQLPTEKTKAATKSPRRMLIYSQPKAGKTSLVAGLESALILDCDLGADHVDCMRVEIRSWTDLRDVCQEVIKAGKPYRYGVIDTATAMESLCLPLALLLYQQTAMGKNYKEPILNLPNGGGYLYLRQAFEMLIGFVETAFPRVILLGHLKDKIVDKGGKEVAAKDIDLVGKLRQITCQNADAIGYLYREANKTILSFETAEDVTCGARPAHLRNKKVVMSEYNPETDTLRTFWEKIYID
jgi:hypothetical protein